MLINILNRLPSMGGSHFVEAQRQDPEVAEYLLDLAEANPDAATRRFRPAGTEWMQEHELLAQIVDGIGDIAAMVASHPLPRKTKPRKPPPRVLRPSRAVDVARARRRNQNIADLDAEVEEAKARWRAQQAASDN